MRHLAALEAVAATGSFAQAASARVLTIGDQQSDRRARARRGHAAARASRREAGRDGDGCGRAAVAACPAGDRGDARRRRRSDALAEGEAGTVRVGTFQSAGVRLLPGTMRVFVERWPEVAIRLTESAYDGRAARAARAGRARARLRAPHGRSLVRPCRRARGPLRAARPATSDLARSRQPVRPRDLAGLPLIGYRRPRRAVRHFCESEGWSRKSSSAPTRAGSSRASSAPGSGSRSCRG